MNILNRESRERQLDPEESGRAGLVHAAAEATERSLLAGLGPQVDPNYAPHAYTTPAEQRVPTFGYANNIVEFPHRAPAPTVAPVPPAPAVAPLPEAPAFEAFSSAAPLPGFDNQIDHMPPIAGFDNNQAA